MKYVIFKHKTGCYMPVIFPQHVTHALVQIIDATPISAGFFRVNSNGDIKVYGESKSLKLKPNEIYDPHLVRSTLNNSGMHAFLDL